MRRNHVTNPTLVIENQQGRVLHSEYTSFAKWKLRYVAWLKENDVPHIVYLTIRSKINAYKIERCSCRMPTFSYAAPDVCERCGESIERKKYVKR